MDREISIRRVEVVLYLDMTWVISSDRYLTASCSSSCRGASVTWWKGTRMEINCYPRSEPRVWGSDSAHPSAAWGAQRGVNCSIHFSGCSHFSLSMLGCLYHSVYWICLFPAPHPGFRITHLMYAPSMLIPSSQHRADRSWLVLVCKNTAYPCKGTAYPSRALIPPGWCSCTGLSGAIFILISFQPHSPFPLISFQPHVTIWTSYPWLSTADQPGRGLRRCVDDIGGAPVGHWNSSKVKTFTIHISPGALGLT